MDKPKVSRQGKKLQLSYELPRRIHTSRIYPVQSSNGSDIIISGTDTGLHFSWRGGKTLYFVSKSEAPLANGTRHREPAAQQLSEEPESDDEALFESDEEELDEDQPYPSIVQDFELPLPSPVLHLALPNIPPTTALRSRVQVPSFVTQNIVVAVACANGSTKIITLPRDPPSAASKRKKRLAARSLALECPGMSAMPRDIALTWTRRDAPGTAPEGDVDMFSEPRTQTRSQSKSQVHETVPDFDLIVALATSDYSGQLHFFELPITANGDKFTLTSDTARPFQTRHLSALPRHISFNTSAYPSPRHIQLLIANSQGCLQIFDPFSAGNNVQRPSSEGSKSGQDRGSGATLATFTSSFHTSSDNSQGNPSLPRRKSIVDARWVDNGRSVLLLFEDGEWGVWDVESPKASNELALRGYIGTAVEQSSITEPKSKSRSKLAPMTPNTRRVRQESLFTGPAKTFSSTAVSGGISSIPTLTTHNTADDSIVLWYNAEAYAIPSLVTLRQRSASSNGRETGLYGPGLLRIEGLDLFGESMTCVNQFPARSATTPTGMGKVAHRELLVTAEHRLVVLMDAPRAALGATSLLAAHAGVRQQQRSGEESPTMARLDQRMLDQGELDLGGVDRLLDDMTGVERTGGGVLGFGKGKRVGFAAY